MILCRDCAAPSDVWAGIGLRQDGPRSVVVYDGTHCAACGLRAEDAGRTSFYYCTTPVSCRWCRQTDPNLMLHHNNHGAGMGFHWGHCMAQHLRRNHLAYAIKHDRADQIHEYLARFLEVWAHMPADEWADDAAEARYRLAVLDRATAPPEHRAVAASTEVALW